MRGSRGSSQLICQESSGANYCRQRRLLLACVSKTAAPTPSHIPRLYLLMCALLMRAPTPPPSRPSDRLHGSHPSRTHFHRLLHVAAPCAEVTREPNPSCLMLDNSAAAASAPTPLYASIPSPTPQSCLFFWLSSSRSRRSTLCSPAPWSTCSPSSIRALKSSASWSVPTLRSSATI